MRRSILKMKRLLLPLLAALAFRAISGFLRSVALIVYSNQATFVRKLSAIRAILFGPIQ